MLLAAVAALPMQSGSIALLSPGAQLRAIEGLSAASRGIELAPYGNFSPPAGGLEPAFSFGFSSSNTWVAEPTSVDPFIGAALNSNVSNAAGGEFGVAGSATGPGATVTAATPSRPVCEQLPQQLQSFGEYWNNHSLGGPPVRLAANSLADPTRGPNGDPSNLPGQGPAGAWCRPSRVPFADSSPLASRAFWTPIVFVLCAICVLWLSRGIRLPR